MKRLIYDLETNGLLPDPRKPDQVPVSVIHCLVTLDVDTGEVLAYWDADPVGSTSPIVGRAGSIDDGLEILLAADLRIGQNVVLYDEAVLRRLRRSRVSPLTDHSRVRCTTIGARVVWPEENLALVDFLRRPRSKLPKYLEGRHSLEAWGYRLGIRKGDFGKTNGWETFTVPMLNYCVQDCKVTLALYKLLERKQAEGLLPDRAWILEQRFAEIIERQQGYGFPFNVAAAEILTAKLVARQAQVKEACTAVVPAEIRHYVTPVKKIAKTKTVPFNPGSRLMIAKYLRSFGWLPDKKTGLTPEGRDKIDETILEHLTYPGIPEIKEYMLLQKRIAAVATGDAAWLKLVMADGRIYGRVQHNAAGTSRSTHSGPNMTQVPKAGKNKDGTPVSPYGDEMRALFGTHNMSGYVLVGGDASGIEMRGLAHYMAPYDGGEYIKLVTTGDPHARNQHAMGLPSRDKGKETFYAFLYGAGDGKLGRINGASVAFGKKIRANLMTGVPALKKLSDAVRFKDRQHTIIRKELKGLDGRYHRIRSSNSALNTLLQSFGALVMKLAIILYHERLGSEGLIEGVDFYQVLFAHDEVQVIAKEQYGKQVGEAIIWAIAEAGRQFGVRCPLTGEYKIGRNWYDTH